MMVHFILPGDTLKSIAKEINLENPVYLKEYHNRFCGREDYIDDDLISGKKLLLPDISAIQNYNAKNDAPFKSLERNPVIGFKPEGSHKNYRISITESAKSEDDMKNSFVSYTASLQWIRNEYNEHVFHYSKHSFSNRLETKVGDLAIGCIESLNPLEIRLNAKGELLRINITKEVSDRFEDIKEELYDRFPDQYARMYIDEFEFVVKNYDLFNKKMKSDWFIKAYFAPIRNPFKNGKSFFDLFLEDQKLMVNMIQEAESSGDDDEITLIQTLSSEFKRDAVYSGKYSVDAQSGMIKNINVYYGYSEYDIQYSTDLMIDELL
ncbi:hypothetical protein N0B16_01265 [Chryseobacterium sp. GMJ5]|uniref:LysM domain-containing protein n=1 Tax=Chryseobacterium gilvum TaxID=2976534 RepID=A0ABT2VTW9_9FLAO|nr:hypothetical protein [Chryseobacterium gilvum]MCU7613058.1 hypothetical protein [Chryseobacterium gilvum]